MDDDDDDAFSFEEAIDYLLKGELLKQYNFTMYLLYQYFQHYPRQLWVSNATV